MSGSTRIKPVIFGMRGCLLVLGLLVLAGCSWKATSPADYVRSEEPSEAWIIATPNPVPAGRGRAKTMVNWYTGDGSLGQVYVSINGGPEQLFSTHQAHQDAIINGNNVYEFRLYAGTDHTTRLGAVTITRSKR